jgi:membrane protein
LVGWVDRVQRRHGVVGFPYAVVKKYIDDGGGRHAALITYYGFLSMFPLLLVGVSVLSKALVAHPTVREQLIDAVVPRALRNDVDNAVQNLPSSGIPLLIGLIGLLFAATGVVFSAYETLNHLAGVPRRARFTLLPRYVRAFAMLIVLLVGGLAVAVLTVLATALVHTNGVEQLAAAAGSAVVVFLVLLVAVKLLVARPIRLRAVWPAAAAGGLTIAAVLSLGARLLTVLVTRSGAIYGTFATVVGIFTLLYLVSQLLLYSAETALVRHARLWPRALDTASPTVADVAVLTRLAEEQERLAVERIHATFDAGDTR